MVSALPVLAALAAVTWLVLWPWYRRLSRWRRMELALSGPPSLPILGNTLSMLGVNNDDMMSAILDLWGGHTNELSRASGLHNLLVFVSDPDHIKEVLRSGRFNNKSWILYDQLSSLLGNGLITSSGSIWKRHRLLTQPAFHLEVLERFVEIFAEESAGFVSRMKKTLGSDILVTRELHGTTARSVMRTMTGVEKEDEPILQYLISELPSALRIVAERSIKPWLWASVVFDFTAMGRELAAYNKTFEDFINRIIDRKKGNSSSGSSIESAASALNVGFKERKTFFDTWKTSLPRSELIDECKTVGGAATETSVATVSYLLKMLSIYPEIQERIHTEIRDVLQDRDGPVTSSDLPRLEYLERALKETMRIFPPLPFLARGVLEDTELLGKQIPGNSTLIINAFSAHRDPRHWSDPLTFDPDRFLPERSIGRHPYCYIPFSAGPRDCIGKHYAMMQMKTIVTTILRAYRVLPVPDGISHPSHVKLSFGVTSYQVGGTKIRFESFDPQT